MMDVSSISALLKDFYPTSAAPNLQLNTTSISDQLTSRLLENNDADADGYLSNSEISSLSSDVFKKLDTDSDGKLSSTEIKTALQKYMDSVSSVAENGGVSAYQTLQSLQSTPEGQLMKALKATASTASSSSQSSSEQASVLQATLSADSASTLISDNLNGFDVSV